MDTQIGEELRLDRGARSPAARRPAPACRAARRSSRSSAPRRRRRSRSFLDFLAQRRRLRGMHGEAPRTSRPTPAVAKAASTTTSRRPRRRRSTSFVADVPKIAPVATTSAGLQAQPRDLQPDRAARLGQAIVGEMTRRRRAEAHSRRTSTSRSRRRRSNRRLDTGGRARMDRSRELLRRAGSRVASVALNAARRADARAAAPASAAAHGWLFLAPNLRDLRRLHVPADRHRLLLRVHRRRRSCIPSRAALCRHRQSRARCSTAPTTSTRRRARKDLFWRAIWNTAWFVAAPGRADGAVQRWSPRWCSTARSSAAASCAACSSIRCCSRPWWSR